MVAENEMLWNHNTLKGTSAGPTSYATTPDVIALKALISLTTVMLLLFHIGRTRVAIHIGILQYRLPKTATLFNAVILVFVWSCLSSSYCSEKY